MIVHATEAQLTEWLGAPAPDNAERLLRSASLLVDRALIGAVYATDYTGKATDETVQQALADATCAQVFTWVSLEIDPAKGAADEPTTARVVRKSIGTGTIEYDRGNASDRSTVQAARAAAATTLTDDAVQILAQAGLLTARVWTYG